MSVSELQDRKKKNQMRVTEKVQWIKVLAAKMTLILSPGPTMVGENPQVAF